MYSGDEFYSDDITSGSIDLEFPPRKPAASAMYRRQATARDRAEQAEDDRSDGWLWELDQEEAS
jgi:hypothetical protein